MIFPLNGCVTCMSTVMAEAQEQEEQEKSGQGRITVDGERAFYRHGCAVKTATDVERVALLPRTLQTMRKGME